VEANTRIETLQAHQANHAESLQALQQILMQQTVTIQNQMELLKSIRANDPGNNNSLTTSTSASTLNSTTTTEPYPAHADNTDVPGPLICIETQATNHKRNRRTSSASIPPDMINGDYPDFANYTRKHRKPLFVLLDNNDNFELRKPQMDGYLHTDKYRSYNWPASSQGLRRCCNIDSVQSCQDNTCYHYASAIICDTDNCVNVYCKNKIGSQPIDSTRYVTTFAPSNDTGIGICATDLIPKATIIGHYVGDIMPTHIHEALNILPSHL
jgi:hypothetical protein